VDQRTASFLANIASDLIIAWKIKDDKILNDYRRRSVEVMYNQLYDKVDAVRKELFGINKKIHGCKFKARSSLYKTIAGILDSPYSKEWMHVEIAREFHKLMQRKNAEPRGDQMISDPFRVDKEEAEKIAQQLIQESDNVEEAKQSLRRWSL